MSLDLPQRLALVQFLTVTLKKLRESDLLPEAAGEWPPGTRMPVKFGGKHAGWASMPEPSKKSAYVKDKTALLDWVRKNYPDKVEPTVEVVVDDDLIAFLADRYPSALSHGERVQPAWLSDILGALVKPGHYVTITGEKLTEVPGIEVPESDPPSPRVNLTEDAPQIIADAWRSGGIPVAEFLALPAAEGEGA